MCHEKYTCAPFLLGDMTLVFVVLEQMAICCNLLLHLQSNPVILLVPILLDLFSTKLRVHIVDIVILEQSTGSSVTKAMVAKGTTLTDMSGQTKIIIVCNDLLVIQSKQLLTSVPWATSVTC